MVKRLAFALLALALGPMSVGALAEEPPANTRWIKGTYEYGVLDGDTVRGHEDWVVTVHPDGTRIAEAFVDLRELGHQTNGILRVDARFRPLEAYVTFWRFGAYGGSAHYWVGPDGSGGDMLHGQVLGPRGQASTAVAVPDLFSLRIHPVITEGWQVWHHDRSGPTRQVAPVFNVVTTSDTGVRGIGMLQDNAVAFHGTETVETPAGTFEAAHYSFYDGRYDIWLWGEDQILVRYVSKAAGREYRLTRLEMGP